MIDVIFIIFIVTPAALFADDSIIIPRTPTANSQAYLRSNAVSSYAIYLNGSLSCRFRAAVIPCDCIQKASSNYTLEKSGVLLAKFNVTSPDITLRVPTRHDLLHELSVFIDSKLCIPQNYNLSVLHRSLELAPGEHPFWTTTHSTVVKLHDKPQQLIVPCAALADMGYYKIRLRGPNGFEIESQEVNVSETSESSLRLRNDSIFPFCTSEYDVTWSLPKCVAPQLLYSIRVLAMPEGTVDHEDRAVYMEEMTIDRTYPSLSISCSQFDIIFEKYCFELVSLNRNTSVSHLWQTACVSTEPVTRQNGGWSDWSKWSDCSTTCGEGSMRRRRVCDNPPPNRGKTCVGDVLQTKPCMVKKCPESAISNIPMSNCTCGCELKGEAGSFFASSSAHRRCLGNQTWWINWKPPHSIIDIAVAKDVGARGKLFFFLGAAYGELIWFSSSNQEPQFTIRVSQPVYIVLWSKENATNSIEDPRGFTVVYSIRAPEPPPQFSQSNGGCHPFCADTMIIGMLGVIFLLIIFVPPFLCAGVTKKIRRHSAEAPLLNNKFGSEMIRSGNTECTQVSQKQNGYVAKRSIGIQLSVQNTPSVGRLTRNCPSTDSPVPRGLSSLSNSADLEYDYYDGTTIPGSLLAPLTADDQRYSAIDIDEIIAQSRIFSSVPTQDVHTQI